MSSHEGVFIPLSIASRGLIETDMRRVFLSESTIKVFCHDMVYVSVTTLQANVSLEYSMKLVTEKLITP
jgi:hypothetical protein